MKRLALLIILAACSSKKPEPAKPTATAAVELELGEMKLIDVNKNEAVVIHADGSIDYPGIKGLTVSKDGKLSKDGQVAMTLNADGTITMPDGKAAEVTLSAEAVVKSGDKIVSIDANGALLGGNPNAPQMKVEGATTTGLKRTALFVLIALTTPGEMKSSATVEGSSTAPVPTPPMKK